MVSVHRTIPQPPATVFAALADPETYPHWLVGARDIRNVEENWPEPGSRFHHRVGLVGPLKVADSTEVLAIDAPRTLSLEVRARPFGRGRATFHLREAVADGGEPATSLEIDEVPLGPLAVLSPVLAPLTAARNRRSLDHLADYLNRGVSHRFPG